MALLWWRFPARALAAVCLVLEPGLVQAQTSGARTGVVAGVVRDSSGAPIAGAEITIPGTDLRTLTGPNGAFTLKGVPVGKASVSVRRLGFQPSETAADAGESGGQPVALTMHRVAQVLPALEVKAGAHREPFDSRLSGFNARRERHVGHFITRDQIEANPNFRLLDALRRFPGVRMVSLRGGVRSVTLGGANCPPTVFVDGFAATAGAFDLETVDLETLEGVEVYTGESTIPPELLGPQGTERCGVIAVWSAPSRARRSSGQVARERSVAELLASHDVFLPEQVDARARYVDGSANAIYPESMLHSPIPGRVLVEFVVDTTGAVEAGTIGIVSATEPRFGTAAREGVTTARFTPARLGGRAVRQVVQLPFDFEPQAVKPPDPDTKPFQNQLSLRCEASQKRGVRDQILVTRV